MTRQPLRPALLSLCILLAVFCIACSHGRGGEGHKEEDWPLLMQSLDSESPDKLCEALGSKHPGITYKASQLLFDQGITALHDLDRFLPDQRSSSGGCGSSARESSFTIQWSESPKDEVGAATTVGDRSLYLIEAIARGDFEFRHRCYQGISKELLLDIQKRLMTLEGENGFNDDSLPKIVRLLGEYKNKLADWVPKIG